MKKLQQRLRSRRGETLVEALVSILVFTLSSILLFSMIASSANINRITRDADERRQTQLSAAEALPDPDVAPSAAVTISYPALSREDEHTVYISRESQDAIYSYFQISSEDAG